MNGYVNPFAASTWNDFSHGMSLNHLRTYRGWKAYQKYKHLFEASNFLFLSERNPFWEEVCRQSKRSNPARSILVINKRKFREVLETYKKDFQAVLGTKSISYDQFLLDMKHKTFLNEILKNHDGLIGTIFGFGRDNAWAFEERKQGRIHHKFPSLWTEEIDILFRNRPTFAWKWFGFCSNDVSEIVGYPTFVADPNSKETRELKGKFLKTRQKIIDYYKGKKFFESTLSILIKNQYLSQEVQ
jgi:hypothetical protein